MARKKTVEPAVEATEVTAAETIETGTEDIKAEAESIAEEKPKKTPAKKRATKTENVKKESVKSAEEAPAKEEVKKAPKKESAGKASARTDQEALQKSTLHIQYAGKSIAQEDLVKSAKGIWEYDLKRKASELYSIELYVKPEENMVYYVMNEDVTGSFPI